jgi:hypothetical protein
MTSRKFRIMAALIVAAPALVHAQLDENALHRRAVEAVIWGMPVVNYDLMYQAAVRANGGFNQIIYWSRLPDWKIQTLTPNAKDTWLGADKTLRAPAFYDLFWDPGEQYDIAFNGAAPTGGNQTSPGRYSGADNGWVGMKIVPVLLKFFEELKTHPNIPFIPSGEGLKEIIPAEYK